MFVDTIVLVLLDRIKQMCLGGAVVGPEVFWHLYLSMALFRNKARKLGAFLDTKKNSP